MADKTKVDTSMTGAADAAKNVPVPGDLTAGNTLNPQISRGQDKEFNTWVRQAHEVGNPEQLSPMQAVQNERDRVAGDAAAGVNRVDDTGHEDTRWVVENVKGEDLNTNK